MRDNFNIENSRHPGSEYETKKVFIKLSRVGFVMLLAIFICSLIAVALLVYNFAVCPQEEHIHHCRSRFNRTNDEKSIFSIATSDKEEEPILKDVRLPRSISPISYDIVIVPYLSGVENFTFDGNVIVKFQVQETCKNITLHSFMLKIHRNLTTVQKVDENEKGLSIKNQSFVEAKQFLIIETEEELEKGSIYLLKLSYIGQIRDNLQGFYRSSYTVNNETKWLASTQFQSTDARRAFPCFDEPELKATFKLTLGRPSTMKTLSNMPLERTVTRVDRAKLIDNYVFDIYPESIKMSTYLVAFVVCDFVNISNEKENFAVWARPDAIHSTDYSLSIGPKIINFLNDFFDIKYPLPKMDLIAVPDFLFGAVS
jgi:aminopeptidase N